MKLWQRLLLMVCIAGTVTGVWLWRRSIPVPPSVAADRELPELPAPEPTPFLNARHGVQYIGAKRCQTCHPESHASYTLTGHARAWSEIDLDEEPPDGEFRDPHQGTFYRIYRQAGQLRHEESIRTAAGEQVVLTDLPVRYAMGSGRFSKSYAIERDGFLFESPATWYAARKAWGLSPGYEQGNRGFQRPIELRCVICHAGRVQTVGNSPQRLEIQTQAIDCERCHGPGELHAARWEATDAPPLEGTDLTIVNPARLTRERQEDICSQCHLHSAATVENRGRSLTDFRPGQRLADFITHYALTEASQEMEVVGHMEQMRLSRCWQASQKLTCTTCHALHDPPDEQSADARYRAQCLSCHQADRCGLPHAERLKKEPEDRCVSCHMPRGPTDIPHFAFTHHRIGIHPAARPTVPSAEPQRPAAKLEPLVDVTSLPEFDRLRNLALGYLQASDSPGEASQAARFQAEALTLLESLEAFEYADPEAQAAFARLLWFQDPQRSRSIALRVMESKAALPPEAETTACFLIGATLLSEGQFTEARPWLTRATTLRPTADLWMMLSEACRQTGDRPAALDAARRASEMAPDRPRYLEARLELLEQLGPDDEREACRARLPIIYGYRNWLDARGR